MARSIVIVSVMTFLISSATAFPLAISQTAPINEKPVEVRLTKSNACKLKYKHKKAAQEVREKAQCK